MSSLGPKFLLILMFSGYCFAYKKNPNHIKYTFALDYKSLNKKIFIEQAITIPEYEITLKSSPAQKTCLRVSCNDDKKTKKKISANQTWNGFYLLNQTMNKKLTSEDLAYRLVSSIEGLDPILALKLVSLNFIKDVFYQRPKTWTQFTKAVLKLNRLLNREGIEYDLYTDIVLVHGYENARNLDYYDENICTKKVDTCDADQLEVRKKLISETSKTLIINYTTANNPLDVELFKHELDYFDIYVGSGKNSITIDQKDVHNSYSISKTESEDTITLNIAALKRKKVPLPDNFAYIFSNNFINCIFFEWYISTDNYNDLTIAESKNIYLSYTVCEKHFWSCKKMLSKEIKLEEIIGKRQLPALSTKGEVLIERLTLGTDMIKDYKKYRVNFEIIVKDSNRISSPKNAKKSTTLLYVPY